MRRQAILFVVLAVVAGASTSVAAATDVPDEETLFADATLYFEPLPGQAPAAGNPITEAKADLGALLYFDTRLSREGGVSCNSCHSLATFGVDNLPTSPGDDGGHGDRNSPTVLNAALHVAQFWDGRAADVEEQAGMPVLNPVEMAIPSEQFLVDRLAAVPEYETRFAQAFPDSDPAVTYDNIRRALAAFERTLITPAAFDRYLEGDRGAISQQAKQGLSLFLELGCSSCHNGATIGGHAFRKFGLGEPYWTHTRSEQIDQGRYTLSGHEADRYVFKVASLRNVEKTQPYFHDGSVGSLEEAVRIMARLQTGASLDDQQVAAVGVFLRSLTGEIPAGVNDRLERLGLR